MKKKGKLIGTIAIVLLFLVCSGIYTAYRLHPKNFVRQDEIITRGEYAAMMAKDMQLDITNAEKDPPSFSDIDGHWSEKYIEALIDAGIIDPVDYSDGFRPDDPITRAEIVKMLVRADGKDEEAKNTQGYSGYDDQADIKDEDKGYAIVGREDGIIGDTEDNKIHPNDPVTKGDAEDLIDKVTPKPTEPTPTATSQTPDTTTPSPTPGVTEQPTPTPTNPDTDKPTPIPSPTPTPSNPGGGSGGGSYYPPAQVRFELPETAHTDSEIQVMPVWKYMKSYTWTITKTAVDGSRQPVELEDAVNGSLGLEGGTVQFKEDGQYTLTAIAKNARGKETVLSKQVTVYPVIDLSFDLPESTHTDKSVTFAFPLEKLYGHDIVWSATKDGESVQPTDILDGELGNEGGTFVFRSKGEYTLTASIIDETSRVFTHSESSKVYPVAEIAFSFPAASHTDTTLNVVTTMKEADGLNVDWSLTKNGEDIALADAVDGTLTNDGGNIRFKDKGVYILTGTLTDETGRTFEASQTIIIYPVGSIGFYAPEITHTDETIQVETHFENLGDATIQWSLTKDGEAVALADALQGELTNDGGYIRFINKGEYILKASFTDPAGRNYSYTAPVKVYPVPGISYTLPETAHTDTIVNVVPETSELGSLKVEWLLENGFGFQDFGTYVSGTLDNNGGSIRFKHAGTYELIARITDETGRVYLFENGGRIEVLPVLNISFELSESTHTDRTVDLRTRGNNNVLPVEWALTKDGEPVELSDVLYGTLNAYGGKIRFTQVGDYALTASMTDALGRVFSYSASTSVYPIPTISLSMPQIWYAGEAGTVSVIGTDLENLTADWTIIKDDGGAEPYTNYASGTLTKPGGTITFPSKGQYELILTMTDPTGRTFIRSQSFTVYPIPLMNLSIPQTWHVGEAGTVGVSGTDLENLTASWTVKRGTGDTKPYYAYASGDLSKEGGTITFPSKGQYQLILTITDVNGRSFTESRSFTVYPIPYVSLSSTQPWYVWEAGTVSVSGTDLENLTASWTISQGSGDVKPYTAYVNGALSKSGGTITFPAKGQYELTLTLTDATGRTFTKSQNFTVYPIPQMNLGLTALSYSGDPIAVIASGSELNGASIDWLISVDGGQSKPYTQYATGSVGTGGGSLTISTDKTIAVKLIAEATDVNGRKFTFTSNTATVKPIASFPFTIPSSVHIGGNINVSLPTASGLEGRTLTWSLTKDGSPASYSGSLSNSGGEIKQCRDDLQKLDRDKIILENELSKEFVEQLSAAISSLTNENENLNAKEKGYKEIIEQNGPAVVGLYHSIQKTGEELSQQIREIEAGLQQAKTQIGMTRQSMNNLYNDQQDTQAKLAKYPLRSEEYVQKIKESRNIETELNIETERVNQQILELKDQLVKIDQGIFDPSQRESMDKQGFETYAFQDVFEFKDTELNQEKEKNLSLLKYTILVDADEKDLLPCSGHYHVPLNAFVPDNSIEPLPFGLSLKKNISPAHAKKAISWLRQISGYLGDKGLIKDNIGVRGYDPDNVDYFLSTAAREYTKTILRAKISMEEVRTIELGARSSEQREITSTLEAQKHGLDKLLSKLSELTEKDTQLEEEFEIYRKKEENLQIEDAKYRGFQGIIVSVSDVFKEAYNEQAPDLSFELDEILARARELIEQIELFESSKKLQIETKGKIEANTAQIAKLETRLAEYKANQEKLEKVNSDIQVWLALLTQEEGKRAALKQSYDQKDKLLKATEQWINEFDKYFSRQTFYLNIGNPSVENDGGLSLEETQAKSENLYLYEQQLDTILTDCGNLTTEIDNLKLEQKRREEQRVKVVDAQKTVERMPEKKQLAESIAELRKQANNCSIDIGVLAKKIDELKENREKSQKSLEQYQEYFNKHREIDFEFLNQYELTLEKLKVEREKHRELLQEFHNLATKQEEYRQQLEQIAPVEKGLQEIDDVIQKRNEENDLLTKQLGGA